MEDRLADLESSSHQIETVDLNGDGAEDVLVLLEGMMWSGTGGSTLAVFAAEGDGYRYVSTISLARAPVIVAQSTHNGWRDLIMTVSGGGMPAKRVALTFDGKEYPLNPSLLPPLEEVGEPEGDTLRFGYPEESESGT